MFLWFCKTVLVKIYTPCQGMIWFSLTKIVSFTLAFVWELNYTIKAWLSLKKTWKNGSRALPSNSRRGLRAPDPENPSSEKMTSQPTFFCCTYFVVCFLLPKCVFFYQWCLSCFITTVYMFLWFCKTVLVKKYTPCQGMIWFSLTNVISFTLAFMW